MLMILILLVVAVVAVSGLIGFLARMTPRELILQTGAMLAASLAMYGLVALL